MLLGCNATPEPIPTEQEVIIVRIPPIPDATLSAGEAHCRFNLWRYEQENGRDVAAACRNAVLPNDGVPLLVKVDVGGDVTVNSEANGNVANLKPLILRLSDIFEQRRANRVLGPSGERVEKGVGVKISISTRYSDAVAVLRAVKESQADPIILYVPFPTISGNSP